MYRPQTRCEWAFVGIAVTHAVCSAVLEILVLARYQAWVNPVVYQVPASYLVPVNFSLVVFGSIYQAVLSYDAVRTKNNLQASAICIFNIGLFILSIMRYNQTSTRVVSLANNRTMHDEPFVDRLVSFWPFVKPALLSSSILIGVCSVSLCFYAYKLHYEFSWALYRHISGSREMRRRYLAYEFLLVLIKVETYFFIGFLIIYGFINVHYEPPEFQLTMSLVPVALMHITLTIHYTRTEGRIGAMIAIIFRLGEIAYLLSRIIVLHGNSRRARTAAKDEMLLYSVTALAFATFAYINAIICMVNFNRGLKPLLLYPTWQKSRPHDFELVSNQPRHSERLDLD